MLRSMENYKNAEATRPVPGIDNSVVTKTRSTHQHQEGAGAQTELRSTQSRQRRRFEQFDAPVVQAHQPFRLPLPQLPVHALA